MKVIRYKIATVVTTGDPEAPVSTTTLHDVSLPYSPEAYALAQREAYQGQVTVEDEPETAEEARARRDTLLSATDWAVLPDSPLDEASQAAMRTYRQALRDVPQQAGFPGEIAWPDIPALYKEASSKT